MALQEDRKSGDQTPLDQVIVGERAQWMEGPPYELFKRLRSECPVHWSSHIPEFPGEAGFHSIVRWDDVRAVSMDWETFSSELGGITALTEAVMPLEMQRGMFIAQDPPKHDRLKALFQRGFTPKRIAEHEDRIRQIVRDRLDMLDPGKEINLVDEFAQPVVARVIGSFMGTAPEDDVVWARLMNAMLGGGDPDLNPGGPETLIQNEIPEIFERCQKLIDARRAEPADDLTTVLVNADVDGSKLEDWEIVMGFFLLMAAGNDSTKSTFCSALVALCEHPEERQKLIDDPALVPSAVEESVRMFPAFAHFRRTATKDTEVAGCPVKHGEKVVMWYVASNRDETRFEDPERFDVERNPDHQGFGAGGRHFCLGAALARLELKVMLEEILARYPSLEITGKPVYVESPFINQLKTLPVRLAP
jgi:cholest-4-en-3-one 26-monooxygenase